MGRRFVLVSMHGAALLLGGGAHAQGSACDQLKATLAARIAPSIGPFTLEAVPADEPVPHGAKAIGTCEAGARRILLRRGGGEATSAAQEGGALPVEGGRRAPEGQRGRAVQAAAALTASAAAPQSAVQGGAEASSPSWTGAPTKPPQTAASAASVALPRSVEPAVVPPAELETESGASVSLRTRELVGRHWQWVLAGVLLLGMSWPLCAWVAHRRTYDEAGLPRGPRLD